MTTTARRDADEFLRTGLLIGNQWVHETTGGHYDHHNPATGKLQRVVPLAGAAEIDHAVAAARAAFPKWRAFSPAERRDLLLCVAGMFRDRQSELATVATFENGVPAMVSTLAASSLPADWFAYYGGWADKIEGESIRPIGAGGLDYTMADPYGVVAAIIPWNAPLASIGMKVAPALAAGNCVIVKPPELVPFTAVRFGEMCLEAGIPAGVVNVVAGGPEAGDALTRHPGVDKISFTGGLVTGRKVMQAAAENLTPVVLELGGKSANIIFPDADFGIAIPMSILAGIVAMSGQGCSFPTRLLVEDSVYDTCMDQAVAMAESVTIGDPFDPTNIMGPVVSAGHCARIEGVIDQAVAQGWGRLLTGGKRLGGNLADGYFLPPTIFGDVDNSSPLAQEEIFGPVLSVIRFRTEDEAIRLANDTKYGLGGYVWTNDLKRAHRVAARMDAGWIGVNGNPPMAPNLPFGGVRDSGFGREGGRAGLSEFLRMKNIYVNLD